jgi:hypothetical protein
VAGQDGLAGQLTVILMKLKLKLGLSLAKQPKSAFIGCDIIVK